MYKHILFVLIATFFITGCSKQLDLLPENGVSPDQIGESNISLFLNALYRTSTTDRDVYVLGDMRGQNYTWTSLSGSSSSYGIMVSGIGMDDRLGFSQTIWTNSYKTIFNANNILQAADKIGADKSNIKTIVGEASYIRALAYFQLVRSFGDVPLILSTATSNVPRDPKDKVYEQIMKDLDVAIANASDIKTSGNARVSIQAAKALKSRILLYQGQKAAAGALAKDVIDNSGKTLDANYGRIFQSTASSTEVLFAFANLKSETNIRMSALFWPYGTTWAGSYFVQPTDWVVANLYTPADTRGSVNLLKITNADGTFNYIVSKYWDVQPMIVSRLSEMYLICAECLAPADGLPYMNALRTTRGLGPLLSTDFDTDAKVVTQVLAERRREFFSEGFLYDDLVRTGNALTLSNTPNADRILLPIPGTQVNLSQGVLAQNKGY